MALLKAGWEKDYYDEPEIYSVGCVGKIVKTQALGRKTTVGSANTGTIWGSFTIGLFLT